MLILIAKHTLKSAIQFIHSELVLFSRKKKLFFKLTDARCITQCVDNIRRPACDLTLTDIARVYETLICLIIESAPFSSCLMDDFRLAHCYVHMKDIVLR